MSFRRFFRGAFGAVSIVFELGLRFGQSLFGRLPRLVSWIVVELARCFFAGLLLVRIFIIRHKGPPVSRPKSTARDNVPAGPRDTVGSALAVVRSSKGHSTTTQLHRRGARHGVSDITRSAVFFAH